MLSSLAPSTTLAYLPARPAMARRASVPKTRPRGCWRLVLALSPLVACSPAQEIPTNVASAPSAASALALGTTPATTTQDASALPTCRSSADCQEGLLCCTDTSSDEQPSHCQSACAAHEACVPDGPPSCQGELVCTALTSPPLTGACLAATPSVECGGLRCSGSTPGCCHSLATHVERCIAVTPGREGPADTSCKPGPDNAAILCRSPSDCGGESCCTHGFYPVTSCESSCASGIDVCLTVADCPDFIGPPIGCAPDPDLPFGIQVCQYAVPE